MESTPPSCLAITSVEPATDEPLQQAALVFPLSAVCRFSAGPNRAGAADYAFNWRRGPVGIWNLGR